MTRRSARRRRPMLRTDRASATTPAMMATAAAMPSALSNDVPMEPSASTLPRRGAAAGALGGSFPAPGEHGKRRRRAGEVETLPVAHAAGAQSPILFLGLDPLGDDPRAGARGDLEQGVHQVLLDQALVDVFDERYVDLQEIGGHLGNRLQRRVARPHIVDR